MAEKYRPKRGDRVRVVVEAEVMYTSADGYFETEHLGFLRSSDEVVSIEKVLPPLPTAPGSVIRSHHGYLYFLTPNGWRDEWGQEVIGDGVPKVSGFDVLFDAGAVK